MPVEKEMKSSMEENSTESFQISPFGLTTKTWPHVLANFKRESGEKEEVSYTEDSRDGNGATYWGLCRFVGVAKDQ